MILNITTNLYKNIASFLIAIASFVLLFINRNTFYLKDDFLYLQFFLSIVLISFALILNICELKNPLPIKKPVLVWGSAAISCVLIYFMIETANENPLSNIAALETIFNLILIGFLIWILFILIGRLRISVIIVTAICYALGVGNNAVTLFKGQPISALDIYSIQTALNVADRYVYPYKKHFWIATFLLVFIISFSRFASYKASKKARLINLGTGTAVMLSFFYSFYNTSLLEKLDISDYLWNQRLAFKDNGVLLSVAYSGKYLIVDVADGYSPETAQEIVAEDIGSVVKTNTEIPNVIAVMNESFADLSVINEDMVTSEEVIPFYNSLKGAENSITGTLNNSTFGGGTANTEFEFLTGATMGFLPSGSIAYQQFIRDEVPSLVSTLNDQGYTSTAIHPYYPSGWRRDDVYPLLGFSEFQDIDDFEGAPAIGGFGGNNISDAACYDRMIDMLESKSDEEKMFLFNVTMQNHGGYSDVVGVEDNITIDNLANDYPYADNYISLLRESDRQLERLVGYLEDYSEPTILVFFGDHQPNFSDGFYSDLYGSDFSQVPADVSQNKYKTPFLIWANYDIAEAELGEISTNYLSSIMLKNTGLEIPAYNEYLYNLSQDLPIICLNGYSKKDDDTFYMFEDDTTATPLIDEYKIVQYNLLLDTKNRVSSMFSP